MACCSGVAGTVLPAITSSPCGVITARGRESFWWCGPLPMWTLSTSMSLVASSRLACSMPLWISADRADGEVCFWASAIACVTSSLPEPACSDRPQPASGSNRASARPRVSTLDFIGILLGRVRGSTLVAPAAEPDRRRDERRTGRHADPQVGRAEQLVRVAEVHEVEIVLAGVDEVVAADQARTGEGAEQSAGHDVLPEP